MLNTEVAIPAATASVRMPTEANPGSVLHGEEDERDFRRQRQVVTPAARHWALEDVSR